MVLIVLICRILLWCSPVVVFNVQCHPLWLLLSFLFSMPDQSVFTQTAQEPLWTLVFEVNSLWQGAFFIMNKCNIASITRALWRTCPCISIKSFTWLSICILKSERQCTRKRYVINCVYTNHFSTSRGSSHCNVWFFSVLCANIVGIVLLLSRLDARLGKAGHWLTGP